MSVNSFHENSIIYPVDSLFSEVFKARAKNDNKFVAMKRVLMENEKEGVS